MDYRGIFHCPKVYGKCRDSIKKGDKTMPNKVICHYGVKGMKWRKLKKVEPDDKRGLDGPTEGMTPAEKRAYELTQSPFFSKPFTDYTDREFNEDKVPRSKDEPTKTPRLHLEKAPRPPMNPMKPPTKEKGINIPAKNRMSPETKKKVDELVNSFLKKKIK